MMKSSPQSGCAHRRQMDELGAIMTNEEAVAAKKAEIEHYEGVLERYGSGRWLDQGRRHLAELKEELRVLESMLV